MKPLFEKEVDGGGLCRGMGEVCVCLGGGWRGWVLHPSNWLVVQVGTQVPVFRKEAAILVLDC